MVQHTEISAICFVCITRFRSKSHAQTNGAPFVNLLWSLSTSLVLVIYKWFVRYIIIIYKQWTSTHCLICKSLLLRKQFCIDNIKSKWLWVTELGKWYFPRIIFQVKNAFSVESQYHKKSKMFRPLNKIKPSSVGLVVGWVTKYEYPVFSNFFFFFSPSLFQGDIKDCKTVILA